MTAIKLKRIDHFVLKVNDIEESCDFYRRVLGMEVQRFGEGRTALRFGDHKINLHPREQGPGLVAKAPSIGGGDFCLITETPIGEVVRHLQAEKVEIISGPGTRAGALGPITSVYFRDPDGNLVEVSNYPD
jgi:catechol 2,3-dioxygenase-like lactoylglutathione lyase family enzyme